MFFLLVKYVTLLHLLIHSVFGGLCDWPGPVCCVEDAEWDKGTKFTPDDFSNLPSGVTPKKDNKFTLSGDISTWPALCKSVCDRYAPTCTGWGFKDNGECKIFQDELSEEKYKEGSVRSDTTCTESPTQSPTPTPTATDSPTTSPSEPPTTTPTLSPSLAPTGSPTKSPTGSPTRSPTRLLATPSPTQSPTGAPTPAVQATHRPTASPTEPPTAAPTSTPTMSPTGLPTLSPTQQPTIPGGTRSPTTAITKAPTAAITNPPTAPNITTGIGGGGIGTGTLIPNPEIEAGTDHVYYIVVFAMGSALFLGLQVCFKMALYWMQRTGWENYRRPRDCKGAWRLKWEPYKPPHMKSPAGLNLGARHRVEARTEFGHDLKPGDQIRL